MFYLFASMILIFSILTVTSRKILRAATYLLFVLIATSGLYFLLNYYFLAAVQLTLYAGGIVVLIVFSILLTSHIEELFPKIEWKKSIATALATLLGASLCIYTLVNHQFPTVAQTSSDVNMHVIGRSLLNVNENGYVLPFEVISILLLAAMIGAIVVAKKHAEEE